MDKKIYKDRKVLRRIDSYLAKQSLYTLASNIGMFIFLASYGGYYTTELTLTLISGGLILLFSAAAFLLSSRFDTLYASGPARWRRWYFIVQIITATFIGLFSALVIIHESVTVNSILMSLYVVGYIAINNVDWSPYHEKNILRSVGAFAPAVFAYVLIVDLNGLLIALGMLVFCAMLIRQSRSIQYRYWDNVRVHNELDIKARDLAYAVNEANNASQFKTEFLANITHEIRTPMNNVLGMLALLDDTELSGQQRELQNVAVHSGEGLLSLIDDILDFSRISSGQIKLSYAVFNLKRCIDQSVELLGPRAHEKGIEISCVYDPDIAVRVQGDQARLVQLISNLVSNAIKYSDGSEVIIHVGMNRLSQKEGMLKVTVSDNGRGVDPSIQDGLFEAFSKKTMDSNLIQPGTGLGLAISKGLAECMGGDIGFACEPGVGTEFWFTAKLQLSTQQAQKIESIKELNNKHVLIAGAEGGLLRSLTSELSCWDMIIESIKDPMQACGLINEAGVSEHPYDLVFINLPVSKAIEVDAIKNIQQSESMGKVNHILVLSSLAQRADAIRAGLDNDASVEWLSKPITREKLCRALINSFDLHRDTQDSMGRGEAVEGLESEGRRILLVEDNAVSQMVAKGMLNKLGYVVTAAVNGKEALGLLEEKVFDLILMDCVMPVLDGYEATQAWRTQESENGRRTPIIAMTASVVEGEQQRCLSSGMDDYLSKPVNLEELSAKLRRWITVASEADNSTKKTTNDTLQSVQDSEKKSA